MDSCLLQSWKELIVKSFIMKSEQNITLHKNILLPQTHGSLIKPGDNLNMHHPSSVSMI